APDRSRPLLECEDREAVLKRLAGEREPLYLEAAHLCFDTGSAPAAAAGARRLQELEPHWQPPPRPAQPHPDRTDAETATRTVEVGGPHPYRITIGPHRLDDGTALAAPLRGRQALIISDATVAPLYGDRLETALRAARPDLSLARFVLPAGEAAKTLTGFTAAIDA